jgi:predicted  nucleic acid-binding Zn-ribbon protein
MIRQRLRAVKARNHELKGERDALRRRCRELEQKLADARRDDHSAFRALANRIGRGTAK